MSRITITHLARNLADIVNRVSYRGERFTVVRGKRPVAELVPAPRGRKLADLPALLEALPRVPVEEADSFSADLADARDRLGSAGGDPWAS